MTINVTWVVITLASKISGRTESFQMRSGANVMTNAAISAAEGNCKFWCIVSSGQYERIPKDFFVVSMTSQNLKCYSTAPRFSR